MILEHLKKGEYSEVVKLLGTPKTGIADYLGEYYNKRDIRENQVGKREDKTVSTESGGTKLVPVAKIPICYAADIVEKASVFLFGSPVKFSERIKEGEKGTESFRNLKNTWDDLRLDSMLLDFCTAVKSETEATIIFYTKGDKGDLKLKSKLITSENGEVIPTYDEYGDLIVFTWIYKNEDEEVFYKVFTEETIYTLKKGKDGLEEVEKVNNFFKKIPVVYLSQKEPEWFKVKELIDRYEVRFSKLADTNDYFGDPIWKAIGSVKAVPQKDDSGKMVKLEIKETDSGKIVQSDLDVITWDHAPESIKMELNIAKELIYDLSKTPNISVETLKGVGNVANYAMELMFLAPILKAKRSEGKYQIVIQRILSVLKSGLSEVLKTDSSEELKKLRVDVEFTSVLPKNLRDIVETLIEATGGKPILSTESAVTMNPMVKDPKAESEMILKEQSEASVVGLGDTVGI